VRILLTVHQFFPDYFSGTEVLTYSVARELVRRGHDVVVFTGYPARTSMPDHERFDEYELEGIRVHRFHHAYVLSEGQDSVTEVEYNNLLAAAYFARLLKGFRADVIHFFHFSRLGVALIDVAASAGIPAFYTPTDFWGVCPTSQLMLADGRSCDGPSVQGGNCVKHVAALNRSPSVARWARRIPDWVADTGVVAARAGLVPPQLPRAEILAMSRRRPFIVERLNALQGIVAPTEMMAGVLRRNGVETALIRKSAYGIDLKGFTPRTRDPVTGSRPLAIGFIGTLAPHKGCHVLIDAFKRLPPGRASLQIYGNPADFPEYFSTLKAAAGETPGICFRGTFPNAKVAEVVDGLDVLVVPSLWFENTPLVVYSALASRAPVIASDFPGMSEVVLNERNGLHFPADDSGQLAQRLNRLLDERPLLPALSAACLPPKSSVQYTDELLALWKEAQSPTTWRSGQHIAPLVHQSGDNYIMGWAVAELRSPKAIAAYSDNGLLAETKVLSPRPDVRDALRSQGHKIDDVSFGFRLVIPSRSNQPVVRLTVTSASGKAYSASVKRCRKGVSFEVDGCAMFGVDDLRLAPELV
jgi:glycosyltransferase involved in cell wall biosynthesis